MASEAATRLRGVLLALAAVVGVLGPECQPALTETFGGQTRGVS